MKPNRTAEQRYARQLRRIAKVVGGLVESHVDGTSLDKGLAPLLLRYSESLTPFARTIASEMIKSVNSNNYKQFQQLANTLNKNLRLELFEAPTGIVAQRLMSEQVDLIKSLPLEAGIRAQKLSMEAATGGRRAEEVAKELMRTEEVTESRAMLIARTEVSRSNAVITQSRAESVGSDGYIWRTSGDGDVRDSHAEMEGQFVRWDSPPTLDGMVGHAGEFPNCRCFSQVLV